MKRSLLIAMLGCGLLLGGCGNQQQAADQDRPATQTQPVSDFQSALQQKAVEVKDQVTQTMDQAGTEVKEATAQIQDTAQQKADELMQKAKDLVTQAQQYLNEGQFSEALTMAQQALEFDPQNVDAQKIIQTAQAKIQELAGQAEQKVEAVTTDVMNTIGTFGQ